MLENVDYFDLGEWILIVLSVLNYGLQSAMSNEFHDDVEVFIVFAEVHNLHDIGMGNVLENTDLTPGIIQSSCFVFLFKLFLVLHFYCANFSSFADCFVDFTECPLANLV